MRLINFHFKKINLGALLYNYCIGYSLKCPHIILSYYISIMGKFCLISLGVSKRIRTYQKDTFYSHRTCPFCHTLTLLTL